MTSSASQKGFTLVEIAIVLLIVTVLLGYTVAMFPRQQELKQYRAADAEMDRIIATIIGFAQVNGRLPCPSIPNSVGIEDGGGVADCNNYGGFVPVSTLGIQGRLNEDLLLMDPWGNPYRYYVTDTDEDIDGNSDFVNRNEMRDIGLVDVRNPVGDGYIDLDGRFLICDDNGTTIDDQCTGAAEVFGRFLAGAVAIDDQYGGAPFVLLSMGKNWADTPIDDELENRGGDLSDTDLGLGLGPSLNEYFLKDVANDETTFVRRPTGFGDDFDDIVKWVSPNVLYSKMIEAGQLP